MVNYKIKSSKPHSILHLTLTLTKSKVQKFNIYIFWYIFVVLLVCTCDCKTEVQCSYSFNQTAPQNLVLKIAQNCPEPYHKHPVVTIGLFFRVVTKKLWIYQHYKKIKIKNKKTGKTWSITTFFYWQREKDKMVWKEIK